MINSPRCARLILVTGLVTTLLVGCSTPQQTSQANKPDPADAENRRAAEAILGIQAEIVAHGDLARNGLEQLLVVNRPQNGAQGDTAPGDPAHLFVTRATIIQNDHGKWTEMLRCDERLKNPQGYLGGSPTAPVTGWHLDVIPNAQRGLEMKFTPAGEDRPVTVRWNTRTKRYQSLDPSQERYLSEEPSSVTPQSVLK